MEQKNTPRGEIKMLSIMLIVLHLTLFICLQRTFQTDRAGSQEKNSSAFQRHFG